MLAERFNVVPGEIRLTAPDAVIFFTGPWYEKRLELTFVGAQMHEVSGLPTNLLARLVHPDLPWHSYRTYHPNYLRRSRQWDLLTVITNLVLSDPAPARK
jgi:hypothetical protein